MTQLLCTSCRWLEEGGLKPVLHLELMTCCMIYCTTHREKEELEKKLMTKINLVDEIEGVHDESTAAPNKSESALHYTQSV